MAWNTDLYGNYRQAPQPPYPPQPPQQGYGQPPYPPQGYMQQPAQNAAQMMTQQYGSRIWVNGKADAEAYPVAPNRAVDLWDATDPTILYTKQADASGKPSMEVCEVVRRADEQAKQKSDYATRGELDDVLDSIKTVSAAVTALSDNLDALRGDVDKMSADLYGIAGKKKDAKKTKSDE